MSSFNDDFRVRAADADDDYTDNSGFLYYNLYAASDIEAEDEQCQFTYDLGETLQSNSVAASNESGADALTGINLVNGMHYAIEVVSPPWDVDGDGADDVQMQIQVGDDGWADLGDWAGTTCLETVDGYQRIYFRSGGDMPVLRVADPGGNWGDNTGTANWNVRAADLIGGYDDPTCETNYNHLTPKFIEKKKVLPRSQVGVSLSAHDITPGEAYVIQTLDGPWYDDGAPSYDLEISDDAGDTWTDLALYDSPCKLNTGDHYVKIYIDPADGVYRLRVNNKDGSGLSDFLNNSGEIWYTLYELSDDPGIIFDDPGGFLGCNAICVRPSSWLNVGEWIWHAVCVVSRFFAWCPYHNEMLASLPRLYRYREPVATFYALMDIFQDIKNETESYVWHEDTGGAGAPTVAEPENFIFGPDQGGEGQSPFAGTGPYSGEEVTFDLDGESYSDNCVSMLADHLGTLLAPGICFATNVLDQLGLTSWYQFFWDTSMLLTFIAYVYSRWINAFSQ